MTRPLDWGELHPNGAPPDSEKIQAKTGGFVESPSLEENQEGENIEFLEEFQMEMEEIQDFDFKSRCTWVGVIVDDDGSIGSNTDRETDIKGGKETYKVFRQDGRYIQATCLSSLASEYFECGQPVIVIQGNTDETYFVIPQRFARIRKILRPFELLEDVLPGLKPYASAKFIDETSGTAYQIYPISDDNAFNTSICLGIGRASSAYMTGTRGWVQLRPKTELTAEKWEIIWGEFKLMATVQVYDMISQGNQGICNLWWYSKQSNAMVNSNYTLNVINSDSTLLRYTEWLQVYYDRTDKQWYAIVPSRETDFADLVQESLVFEDGGYDGALGEGIVGSDSKASVHFIFGVYSYNISNLGLMYPKSVALIDNDGSFNMNACRINRRGIWRVTLTTNISYSQDASTGGIDANTNDENGRQITGNPTPVWKTSEPGNYAWGEIPEEYEHTHDYMTYDASKYIGQFLVEVYASRNESSPVLVATQYLNAFRHSYNTNIITQSTLVFYLDTLPSSSTDAQTCDLRFVVSNPHSESDEPYKFHALTNSRVLLEWVGRSSNGN